MLSDEWQIHPADGFAAGVDTQLLR
jgi:hypothetical protein